MRVSVVIPALDAAATIHECLSAIGAQTRQADEIIVADNGSRDATAELVGSFAAAHPGLRVVTVDAGRLRRGPGPVRNAGARAATGDILAFTDADCIPSPEWLARITEPIESGSAAAIGSVVGDSPRTTSELLQALLTSAIDRRDLAARPANSRAMAMTNSFAIRSDVFRNVGTFDERLRWLEDTAITLSLRRSGHALAEVPGAIVAHHVPSGVAGLFRRAWKYGFQSAGFFRLYHPRRFILEATRRLRVDTTLPIGSAWIVLSPDKVVVLAMLPGLLHPLLALLALLPIAYYYADLLRRASQRGIRLGALTAAAVLLLDLAYHLVQSAGRLAGSLSARIACL